MNKRIQELAEQATQEFSPAFESDKWQAKFAELIIKECHMLAVGNANWLPKDVSPAAGMNDVLKNISELNNEIEQTCRA